VVLMTVLRELHQVLAVRQLIHFLKLRCL